MSYRSLESMIRNVLTEGLIDEASLGDSRGLMALAKRKRGDEKDVMMRTADMMKKGQIKDLNMFMKAMDNSTHKLIMPFIDKKHHKALHEDIEEIEEKTLTPAELKKREEVAKALERENPKMPMPQKMAIATATAKKVAEEEITNEARGYGEADTHIIMQLRSAQDLDGKKDIQFRGGKKAKVDKKHIDKILKIHDHPALKPVQKRQIRVAISKSPKHLADFANKLKMEDYSLEEKFANPAQQAAVMAKLKATGKYKKKDEDLDETKGAPKGYHFTRSGKLRKGDAGQDGPGGAMLRSDPLDKQRKKIPPLPEEKANEDCWDGYRQDGMKKKGDRMVPNCVPEEIGDDGKEVIHTRKADYKLTKVRQPDGRMAYRKVKREIDIEK